MYLIKKMDESIEYFFSKLNYIRKMAGYSQGLNCVIILEVL